MENRSLKAQIALETDAEFLAKFGGDTAAAIDYVGDLLGCEAAALHARRLLALSRHIDSSRGPMQPRACLPLSMTHGTSPSPPPRPTASTRRLARRPRLPQMPTWSTPGRSTSTC